MLRTRSCSFMSVARMSVAGLVLAGIELLLSEDGDVWLRVESERPVFVLSDYLTHAAALDRDRNANLSSDAAQQQSSHSARTSVGEASSSSPESAAQEPPPGASPAAAATPPAAASLNANGGGGGEPARVSDQCGGGARSPSFSFSSADHVHKIYPNSNPIKVRARAARSLLRTSMFASVSLYLWLSAVYKY